MPGGLPWGGDVELSNYPMICRQCCITFQNLLSCMTLDMENCLSTVHVKQANMSKAEYCRSFGLAMKEAVKRVTTWAA